MTSPELTPRKVHLSTRSLHDWAHSQSLPDEHPDELLCPCTDCEGPPITKKTLYLQMMEQQQEREDGAFREAMAPNEPETLHERIERIIDSEGA